MSYSYTLASYAARQRDPRRFWSGIALVAILHLVLGYALVNGLGRKILEVAQSPLMVNLLEEVKPPEPLPPPPPLPPSRVIRNSPATPAPVYRPPVETQVEAPPPLVTVTEIPPEPVPFVPPVPEAPPAPPTVNVGIACPNHLSVPVEIPPQAERMGLSGKVVVEFTVTTSGAIRDVRIAQSSHSLFNRAATAAIAQYRCIGQGQEARVRVPFLFQVEN
ncbi:MAG: energy transducer TonB [Zoogloeaceae bacterium]|jgi:protein TonB|nr:energy transducer TonB [Zoogloeaceae bacterium]